MTVPEEQLTPLARSVLSAQVKDRLLRWIIEVELPPGSRIIETRVARQLGTSQAPVREALRDLAALGLVDMHAFRGARQAARDIDDETLAQMNGLIERMRQCATAGDAHG